MWIECGKRALISARTLLKDARSISRITSSKISEIVPAVEKLSEALKAARFSLVKFERDKILDLADKARSLPNPLIWTDDCDNDTLRLGVNEVLNSSSGYCPSLHSVHWKTWKKQRP